MVVPLLSVFILLAFIPNGLLAVPSTVPAFLWSSHYELASEFGLKESVNYQVISPYDLAKSVISEAGWSNFLCKGKNFDKPLDLALLFVGRELQSSDLSMNKHSDSALLDLLKNSFARSNTSVAFPYVSASEDLLLESTLVSGLSEACGDGTEIANVAFHGSCSVGGTNHEETNSTVTFPCPKSIAMNSLLASSHASSPLLPLFRHSSKTFRQLHFHSLFVSSNTNFSSMVVTRCSSAPSHSGSNPSQQPLLNDQTFHTQVTTPQTPSFLSPLPKLTSSDQAFFLLAFIASTTSVAFASFVAAAVPALFAIRNAAISLSKLADTAREELPSTMTAIRLSGMEISDLTLELSDLSQEVADGVNASAQVVQAAEAKLRQFSSMARQQTESMIQERASLPIISLQPAVAGAARKTTRAVGRATKSLFNIISGRQGTTEYDDEGAYD